MGEHDPEARDRLRKPLTLHVLVHLRPGDVCTPHTAAQSSRTDKDVCCYLQCDTNPTTGRVSVGISAIIRITLRDGTVHEDVGYGEIANSPSKAAAFDKVRFFVLSLSTSTWPRKPQG